MNLMSTGCVWIYYRQDRLFLQNIEQVSGSICSTFANYFCTFLCKGILAILRRAKMPPCRGLRKYNTEHNFDKYLVQEHVSVISVQIPVQAPCPCACTLSKHPVQAPCASTQWHCTGLYKYSVSAIKHLSVCSRVWQVRGPSLHGGRGCLDEAGGVHGGRERAMEESVKLAPGGTEGGGGHCWHQGSRVPGHALERAASQQTFQ